MYVSYTCVFMCVYVYLQLNPLMLHQRGGGGAHKAGGAYKGQRFANVVGQGC